MNASPRAISVVNVEKIGLKAENPTNEELRETGLCLRNAFSLLGFVYVSGHGLDDDVIAQAFDASLLFFRQPTQVKLKYLKEKDHIQGYVKPGMEMLDRLKQEKGEPALHELREAFDVDRFHAGDVFPDLEVPSLRTSLAALTSRLVMLNARVLRALALALDLEQAYFLERHCRMLERKGNTTTVRSIYYPPIPPFVSAGSVRLGEHSDYGTLTYLLQDNIGGLEIKTADRRWIEATPVPGCILVNIGDLLEMWTNGLFPATRHRVAVPQEEVRKRTHRQSMVLFMEPDEEVWVSPFLGQKPLKDKYSGTFAGEYVRAQLNATYEF